MTLQIETLQTAFEYIPKVVYAIDREVEGLRRYNTINEESQLEEILEGLNWIIDVIFLTKEVQYGKISVKEIIPIISEVLAGLKNMDLVYVSDILEYEINPLLIQWNKIIQNIIEDKNC